MSHNLTNVVQYFTLQDDRSDGSLGRSDSEWSSRPTDRQVLAINTQRSACFDRSVHQQPREATIILRQ